MHQTIARLIREDEGQDLIEYALLAGFISLVAIAAVTLVGEGVNNVFGGVKTKVDSIPTK
jgi:pilus assembly protein Flp/PilA